MQDAPKNNFDQRGGELMPRELMERAADPALVPDEALVAILLKTGVRGLNVIELSRRLIEAFGSMKSLVSGDWRTLEERIKNPEGPGPRADFIFAAILPRFAQISAARPPRATTRASTSRLRRPGGYPLR